MSAEREKENGPEEGTDRQDQKGPASGEETRPTDDRDDQNDRDERSETQRRKEQWANRIRKNTGQALQAGEIKGDVHYHQHIGEQTTRRLRQTAEVPRERVEEVVSTFCPPDTHAYSAFLAGLDRSGTGVIMGRPGTGRTVTAIHSLVSCRPGKPIEQLTLDLEEKDAGVSHIDLDADHTYYLDLTSFPALESTHQVALRNLVKQNRVAESMLVFIARAEQANEHVQDLQSRLTIDGSARAVDVFDRVMRSRCGDTDTAHWLGHRGLQETLDGAEPVRALRIVHKAKECRPGEGALTDEDYTTWIKEVLQECADATEELASWFKRQDLDTEFRRVLLATVAVLEGGHRTVIVEHADRLARRWHIPSLWRTPISGEGLTPHLWETGAQVREDTVRFKRPGSAADVLDYLWREHPGTRGSLQEWAAEAVLDLPTDRKVEAARRWFELARRHEDVAPVQSLINFWGVSRDLMWYAVPAIAEAAVTPELGALVRAALYDIVRSTGSPMKDRTVLEVCRVYGRVRPESALTRIRLITEKASALWDQNLVSALQDIAAEPDHTAVVLRTLGSWTADPGKGRRKAVAGTALARLLGDRGDASVPTVLSDGVAPDVLVDAWRTLTSAGQKTGRPLWNWFDFLESGGRERKAAFEVLWSAAHGDEVFHRDLERSVQRWKCAHELEGTVPDRLLELLNEREEDR
ncbi:hypothetical protein [Nocardiopsis xinjiangensis]|uniref:hypothetical protein n=1 Tax=Nocardiopsis xinjiangensis TaxID=124285 RepID=UPI0003682B95|nr:hypothetical protein [Nocardiopsis xinjiangensis]